MSVKHSHVTEVNLLGKYQTNEINKEAQIIIFFDFLGGKSWISLQYTNF